MKFSVVMACYHGDNPDWMLSSIETVFAQTLPPNELIIVADGNIHSRQNDILEGAKKLGNLKIIKLKENVGPGLARHHGIKATKNNFVAIMDADDLCRNTRFEKQIEILSEGVASLVGGWIEEFDVLPGDLGQVRKVPEKQNEILKYAKSRSPMNNVTVMFRKDRYLEAGGFNRMRSAEDYDLYVRMILLGAQFHNVQEVLVDVRSGTDMLRRRGGLFQASDEIQLFHRMYKNKFISFTQMLLNIGTRILFRIIPNSLRHYLYQKFLRD